MVNSIVADVVFLKLFPKICRKWILLKVSTRIQVSSTLSFEHILFFIVSLRFLNLKFFESFQSSFFENACKNFLKLFVSLKDSMTAPR